MPLELLIDFGVANIEKKQNAANENKVAKSPAVISSKTNA